jgi:hypothetical protein
MFRTLSDRITVAIRVSEARAGEKGEWRRRTLIFANILQSEGQASVLPLDDADLPKCAFPDDPQQAKMIEVH